MAKEETTIQPYLRIHPDDNVLVALSDLAAGTDIPFEQSSIILQQNIPAKHKFFVHNMHQGDEVIMYGTLVGKVQVNLSKGSLMTTENTKHAAGKYAYRGFHYQ